MNKLLITTITALVGVSGVVGGWIGRSTASHPKIHKALFSIENEATKIFRSGFRCGVERWSVKTLSDADVGSINFVPKRTNIPFLRSLTAPASPTSRVPNSAETQVWKLSGTHLVAYKEELDSDIHLKLQNPSNGQTMIAELADSNCISSPDHRLQIATARANFVKEVGQPTGYYQYTDVKITLTGVGFFDFVHGQNGVAPNGIELHPVLSFRKW